MNAIRWIGPALAIGLSAIGCTAPVAHDSEKTGAAAEPIVNGTPWDQDERVVLVYPDMCTGTMLDNHWMLTAQHCAQHAAGDISAEAGFHRGPDDIEWYSADFVVSHPTLDAALVHFANGFTIDGSTSGYRNPEFRGAASTLQNSWVACAGYGWNDHAGNGGGTLRIAYAQWVDSVTPDGTQFTIVPNPIDPNQQIPEHGDSGGPCFNSSWEQVGIHVSGTDTRGWQVSFAAIAPWADAVMSY